MVVRILTFVPNHEGKFRLAEPCTDPNYASEGKSPRLRVAANSLCRGVGNGRE